MGRGCRGQIGVRAEASSAPRIFGATSAGSSSSKRTWTFPSGIASIKFSTRSRSGIDGKVIEHAITTNEPKLRYPVSWAGPEMAAMHDRISDDDWVGLGAVKDDAEYISRFQQMFGVDIST